MKVLLISHNVLCQTSNMGKTLSSYFYNWEANDIAQLYIHSEVPTSDICHNYYRITDKEMIKSVFVRKSGTILNEKNIRRELVDSRIDTGSTAKLYQKARKRTPLIYFIRNLWWKLGKWKTKKLLNWVDDFNPDIVFLASGDYYFIYDIALELAKYKNIPLVISCMDDYYLYNKNEKKIGGKKVHKTFMKHVRKAMEYASCIYPICEKMGKDYYKLFNKPYHTLFTPSSFDKPLEHKKTNSISYVGNLGYKRYEQIIKLGKVLKSIKIDGKPECIDVYSAENRPEILAHLTEENGINFHGKIGSEEVKKVLGESLATIHTESFDEVTRKSVAYSVSTKIADSLASGTPILAYGPKEIASIEHLLENGSAYCITDDENLENKLIEFITDEKIRQRIVENAIKLANKDHNKSKNCKMIIETMEEIVSK